MRAERYTRGSAPVNQPTNPARTLRRDLTETLNLWFGMSDKGDTEDRPSGRRAPVSAVADRELPLDHHIEEMLATLSAVRRDGTLTQDHSPPSR